VLEISAHFSKNDVILLVRKCHCALRVIELELGLELGRNTVKRQGANMYGVIVQVYITNNLEQGRRQKIFQGGGPTKKKTKIPKKYRKIALFSLFQGGPTEKNRKVSKKGRKYRTFKPLTNIFIPCLKIQGGGRTASSAADAHDLE